MRSLIGHVAQVFSGLRFRLLLMLLLACSPLVVVTLYTALNARHDAMTNWQQTSARLSSSVKHEEDHLIESTKLLLLALSEESGIRSMNPVFALQSLERIHTNYPRYSNLGVATTNGEILVSLAPMRNHLLNRRLMRRAAERERFLFGKFPLGATNSKPIIDFGSPVMQTSGPAAVVFAEIDLSSGAGAPRSMRLPEGANWMEIDQSGTILAHYPDAQQWVGKKVQDPWLLANAFAQTRALMEGPAKNKSKMFYAFQTGRSRLTSAPRVAFVLATPKQALFAKADRAMWQSLSALSIAIAIALVLGWIGSQFLVLRPVKALVKSSARLAAGDLSVRTGLRPSRDELGKLTLAFDQMAGALEQREMERQRSSHKLQALSQKLVEVQETERRHIARELHDEIGQSLTAAEMNLQAALRMHTSTAIERRLEESIHSVERVLEQVHDLSLNLRPSMLDDLGLEPALRWYTHRQANLTGLRAEFNADKLEERLDPMIETECFRVAQEALTNVVRHSQASGVSVELRRRNGHLHLSVKDDGVGFDVGSLREKAVNGASLGLLSMEERASLAGGGLELNSIPGQGTEVHAWFPLKLNGSSPISHINE